VYVVESPSCVDKINRSTIINYLESACARQNASFITYKNRNDFADNRLFCDPWHLNGIGADKFSSDFAHLLVLNAVPSSKKSAVN
jgi:hypothetical protein